MANNQFFRDKMLIMEYQYNLFNHLGFEVDYHVKKYSLLKCIDKNCNGKRAGFYISYKDNNYKFRCNHCQKIFDIIDFFQYKNDLTILKKSEVAKLILKYIKENNIPKDTEKRINFTKKEKPIVKKESTKNIENGTFLNYYSSCRENLKNDFSYMLSRGFLEEEKEQFYKLGIGLDNNKIIFPITNGSYIRRYLTPKMIDGKEVRYTNSIKIKEEDHYVWQLHKINNNQIIYIFEGIMDALTMQILNPNYLSIATAGATANLKRLASELEKKASKEHKIILLLCCDNDDAGERGTRELKEIFKRLYLYALDVRKSLINYNIFTEEIKENRYHELMAAQAEISEENNRNLIGVDTEVLVEELLDDGCGNLQAKGRASFQAPEVDGNVYIDHPGDLRPGDFVKAHIIDGYAYDLIANRIMDRE